METLNPKAALERFQLLKAMDTVIGSLANDDAFFIWTKCIPREAADDDLMDLVLDDHRFDTICFTFRLCLQKWGKDGFLPYYDKGHEELFGAARHNVQPTEQEPVAWLDLPLDLIAEQWSKQSRNP